MTQTARTSKASTGSVADLTNAQIAAAFEDWPTSTSRRRRPMRRSANAARSVRDSSVSVAQLAREGRVTELPGIGKTLEEKRCCARRDRRHPGRPEAAREDPGRPRGRGTCRASAQAGEAALRRAGGRLARCPAGLRGGRIRGLRGFGARWRRTRRVLADHDESGRRRGSCSAGAPRRRPGGRRSPAHLAADRVEVAGSPPPGRLGEGHRRDRHGLRPGGAGRHAQRAADRRGGPERRRRRCPGQHPLGHEDRPQGRRARPVRQRAPALHGPKAHNVALREERSGLHGFEYGILDDATGETLLRDRGGGLRGARPAVDPAGAARGPGRARGGHGYLPEPSSSRIAASTHATTIRRAPDGRGDGGRRPRAG